MHKYWKQEEIDYLIERIKTESVAQIAHELGRSHSSVASYMRLNKIPKRKDYWSDDELDILKKYYSSSMGNAELMKMLPGRTSGTIKAMASYLGVKRKSSISILGNLTESEKGYIAGLVDGEGNISFRKLKYRNGKFYYRIIVRITNTDKKLIDWIVGHIPIAQINEMKTDGIRKTYYVCAIDGFNTVPFLREISPYLVSKKDIADKLSGGFKHLSAEEREALHNWVVNRNGKGINHTLSPLR